MNMKKWLRVKLQEFLNMSKHIKLSTWMTQTDRQLINMEEEISDLQTKVEKLELENDYIYENMASLNSTDIISLINNSSSDTRIKGKSIHLDSETLLDDNIIKPEHIDNTKAEKIAENVLKNLSASQRLSERKLDNES